jgi:hypothetical protein
MVAAEFDGRLLPSVSAARLRQRVGFCGDKMLLFTGRELTLIDPLSGASLWKVNTPSGSLVGWQPGLVAVLSGTKLNVYSPESGEQLSNIDLGPLRSPLNLYLLRYDDATVVGVDERRGYRTGWNNGFEHLSGKLLGIDLGKNEVLWKYETEEGSVLRRDQPAGLPLLVVAGRYKNYNRSKNKRPDVAILTCLDVRDGRVLEESQVENAYYVGRGSGYLLDYNSDARTATLKTPNRTVAVTFSAVVSKSNANQNTP